MTAAEFAAKECRRQKVYLWGKPSMVTPRLVDWVHGDGKQVIYFTPLATRPNYYVVRIDSKLDLRDRDRFHEEVLDDLYSEVEEQFGASYEEWEHDNGRTYKRHNHWPALNDSCGSAWGQIFTEVTR